MGLTEAQQRVRMANISASQFPIIIGKSPFDTAHTLSRWKVTGEQGFRSQDLIDAGNRGQDLELCIAQTTARKFGVPWFRVLRPKDYFDEFEELRSEEDTLFHPEQPFVATPDYLVMPVRGGKMINLECKSSASEGGWYANGIPDYFSLQAQWQMFIMRSCGIDIEQTMFGALVCMRWQRRWINYDYSLIEPHLEECLRLQRECNAGKIRPMIDTKRKRLPESDMTDEQSDAALQMMQFSYMRKSAEAQYQAASSRMGSLLLDGQGVTFNDGAYISSYKEKRRESLSVSGAFSELENLLIEDGRRDEVNEIRKRNTEFRTKKAYVSYNPSRRKKK